MTGVPEEIKQATRLIQGFLLAKVPFAPPAMGHVMLLIGHLLDDDDGLPDRDITWH